MAPGTTRGQSRDLPEATVLRLPVYQRILAEVLRNGQRTISSEQLGALAGENPANVRRDLSRLGTLGTRGSGYEITSLISAIDRVFGATLTRRVVLAGVGNLGRALVNSPAFFTRGFALTHLFDTDPSLIGTTVCGVQVQNVAQLTASLLSDPCDVGVIATTPRSAQQVATAMVNGGVTHLLTFAPRVLEVPVDTTVRYIDLGIELQVLGYFAAADTGSLPPLRATGIAGRQRLERRADG